jgi:peroxiredoxin
MKLLSTLIVIFSFNVFSSQNMTLTEQLEQKALASSKRPPSETKKTMQKAHIELKKSGIVEKAIKKSAKAPEFSLNGKSFSSFYNDKPVVLKFYRGSWCPYCQIELKAYESYKKRIEAKGYQVLIITPDSKKEIKKFKVKQNITFSIFSDTNNDIAKKFGIAFKIGDELNKVYKGFGIDLEQQQGNSNNELPLPGTYVINKEGIITYAFIDVDYKKRLDPEVLLREL